MTKLEAVTTLIDLDHRAADKGTWRKSDWSTARRALISLGFDEEERKLFAMAQEYANTQRHGSDLAARLWSGFTEQRW
jgi:hypothetical protein